MPFFLHIISSVKSSCVAYRQYLQALVNFLLKTDAIYVPLFIIDLLNIITKYLFRQYNIKKKSPQIIGTILVRVTGVEPAAS